MRIAIQAENLVGGSNFQHAGVGRYSFSIIDSLLRIGSEHEWHLLVSAEFNVPESWGSQPNFIVHRIPKRLKTWRAFQRTPYLLTRFIDVLFVLSGPTCNHSFIKKAVTVHDLFPFDYPEAFNQSTLATMQHIATQQILKSDLIFCVSENTRKRVQVRFPAVPTSNLLVTPNGPGNVGEPVTFSSVGRDELQGLGVPFDKYVFTLGTLEPRKNLAKLIEAFYVFWSVDKDPNVGLVIGGGKGWSESSIFEIVENLGIQSQVVFLGYVSDDYLPCLFGRSQAFVCASIDEGFGIPILEGMMYGTPVITSNRGALPEVGADAVMYFDPTCLDSIVEALQTVLSPGFDREPWIQKGLSRSKAFSWQSSAEATLQGLLSLSKQR